MKKILLSILLFTTTLAFSQQEASVWYFGHNAGLKFNSDNTVTALTDGQLDTEEGCATISNFNGQLLFYTDGVTVYNKNHLIMINGTGLMGHTSSAQSATIVPKPGSSNLYYIFTSDVEHNPNGFRYSIVDMNLDGGNGAVTTDKNVLIYTPTIEGFGITKHSNGTDYWIISHEWNSNNFRSYLLTNTGLNATPIVTSIGQPISGVNSLVSMSIIKLSPSGSKLAITSGFNFAELFNFDNNTGTLSNPIVLFENDAYGIAFSPDESKLYISSTLSGIYQYDLLASNIPASSISFLTSFVVGQLQLAPDNKIYIASYNSPKLSVINDPNLSGISCNIQFNTLDLAGKKSMLGLPSFNQSFFTPAIQFNSVCEGNSTSFSFNTNQTILNATWNFGDGNTSNQISPTHTYTTAGNYTVSVTVTTPNGTGTNNRTIVIYPKPTLLSTTISLKQCDDNLDGFSNFNLNETIPLLVANSAGLTFTFHETLADAQSKTGAITNVTAYANQVVSNDVIYARVENANGCYSTAQINLRVSTTLIPASFMITKNECDDTASGSNTDGIATFDFSTADTQIRALYPTGQLLTVTYYKNLADALAEANAITNTSSYTNTGYPNTQNIYVRVESQINNECLGLGHHITLNVDRIPIVQPQTIRQCDDNQDGIFSFNTTTLQSDLLNGLNNVVVTYTNQAGTPVVMTNPFSTTSQKLNVNVKNNFGKQCDYTSTVEFIVDDLPEAFSIPTTDTTRCDDETYPALQNGTYPFDTSSFQAKILGSQTGMQVNYYDANNVALSSPLPNPFITGTQTIRAEVINATNTTCKVTVTIPFVVKPSPEINPTGAELVCSNNTSFTKTIDAGLLNPTLQNNFTYKWYKDGVLLPMATAYSLVINAPGTYTVSVKGANDCSKTRTITAVASDIAVIDSVIVNDLTENNSILILVSGSSLGDYVYSIDNQTYQESNFFNNVFPDVYTVYVKDKRGCGITSQEISVLGVPSFFTPNGDGYNDYWNIKGFNRSKNTSTKIRIYDRYGKLIKQICPTSLGWDGTYNGNQLPSDDYWYSIELEDGRILKGHFALKR